MPFLSLFVANPLNLASRMASLFNIWLIPAFLIFISPLFVYADAKFLMTPQT
jgi:hypothetical protein